MTKHIANKTTLPNIIMISIIALQIFITAEYLFLNDVAINRDPKVVLLLIFTSSIIIPISYLSKIYLNILYCIVWITMYSIYVFFVLDAKMNQYFYISQIFLIPLIIISISFAKKAHQKSSQNYNKLYRQRSTYARNVDQFTGLLNARAFEQKLYHIRQAKKNFPTYNFYISGIHIPFFHSFINTLGNEAYIQYLNEVTKQLNKEYDLHSFYAVKENLLLTYINFLSEQEMINLNNNIKQVFIDNLPTNKHFRKRTNFRTAYLHANEIEIRNLYTVEALQNNLLKKTEVDVKGNY